MASDWHGLALFGDLIRDFNRDYHALTMNGDDHAAFIVFHEPKR